MRVYELLNNASISAFLGAFSAFMLVVLNDWRRERRKLKTLRAEIEVNREDALAKLETARRARSRLREQNRVTNAPVLAFNTTFTRQLTAEVLHHLSLDHRRATEALCYTMEATDKLFSDVADLATSAKGVLGHADRISLANELDSTIGDAISNLKRLIDMCDMYLSRKYSDLLNKQYDPADYEE